ncbi:DUF1761 domain-containing protein [Wenxinia saemankumensis]|uniref:DUF1761 domain-containing protein n=1 Tax=Wenxinia saemankumensis TaxID=1447782 RepID=A0A1M6G419_9RHOB|nr:DUF1761 domain-containing protein [Wenxinia saemankumensis]SHJ04602.1 Protein of unknown function [Wenxinia saemankumensis]
MVAILVAALAAWLFGAAWYMALSGPWKRVSGVPCDENGNRRSGMGALPFVLSGVAMVVVAAMMRHTFAASGLDTLGAGIVGGGGIGLFFVCPWILINNAYPGRPVLLTLIDGGYALFGCAIIGAVLVLLP